MKHSPDYRSTQPPNHKGGNDAFRARWTLLQLVRQYLDFQEAPPEADSCRDYGLPRMIGWSNEKSRKHVSDHAPVFVTLGNAKLPQGVVMVRPDAARNRVAGMQRSRYSQPNLRRDLQLSPPTSALVPALSEGMQIPTSSTCLAAQATTKCRLKTESSSAVPRKQKPQVTGWLGTAADADALKFASGHGATSESKGW